MTRASVIINDIIVNELKSDLSKILTPTEISQIKKDPDYLDNNNKLYDKLFQYYMDNGEMPYGTAKARTGDPIEWIYNKVKKDLLLESAKSHVIRKLLAQGILEKDSKGKLVKKSESAKSQMVRKLIGLGVIDKDGNKLVKKKEVDTKTVVKALEKGSGEAAKVVDKVPEAPPKPVDKPKPKAELEKSRKDKIPKETKDAIAAINKRGSEGPRAADAGEAAAASAGHALWQKDYKAANGDKPRIKKTKDADYIKKNGTDEVDIAKTDFKDLPKDIAKENTDSGKAARYAIADLINGYKYDGMKKKKVSYKDEDDLIEKASSDVHDAWMKRNGSWAPPEQMKPYKDLTDDEKEKDRLFVREYLKGVAKGPSKEPSRAAEVVAKAKDVEQHPVTKKLTDHLNSLKDQSSADDAKDIDEITSKVTAIMKGAKGKDMEGISKGVNDDFERLKKTASNPKAVASIQKKIQDELYMSRED